MASTTSGLDGLLDLAQRDGVDVRPTLLRVLTDLYTQIPAHTIDDERQYTELALRLIDAVDISARAALARRLASYEQPPQRVIQRLARDVIEVAEPILRHPSLLTSADCRGIAEQCGEDHAQVIARRGKAEGLQGADPDPGRDRAPASTEAIELCELFFSAEGTERRLIAMNLDYLAEQALPVFSPLQQADVWRLEWAALKRQTDAVARELERALGISARMARRIVADESGEPVVIAAKAIGLPADVLQRMLLFMNPRIGHSVDRVYQLASLYTELSGEAARRLVAIWRDADPVRPVTRHEALHWRDAAETARRALSTISPAAPRRDAPSGPPRYRSKTNDVR
jgi:uncharacterized protein (DUF2336 family)